LERAGFEVSAGANALQLRDEGAWFEVDPSAMRIRGIVDPAAGRLRMHPLSWAILVLLRHHDLYPMHGAALASDNGGLMIVADSGGGKSTLTAQFLRADCKLVSDDSLLLCRTPEGIQALALRRDLFVLPDNPLADEAEKTLCRLDEGKLRVDYRRRRPQSSVDHCFPRLLLFPEIVDAETSRIDACPDDDALHLLAHHGLVAEMPPGRARRHFQVLAELVGQCRCLRLTAGRDLLRDPSLVAVMIGVR